MSAALTDPTKGRPARPSLLPEHFEPEWDPSAEQAVLGGVLVVPEVMEQVAAILEPEHFFLPCHQKIFAAALSLRDEESVIDPITLADRVAADPDVGAQGGRNYIWALPDLSVPAVNAPHHARIVKALALRRRAKDIAWAVLDNRIDAGDAQVALLELGVTEASECLPTVVAADFCLQVPETPDWILEGYVARGTITELDAKIKTGKTHLTSDLVRAVLAGEEFLERKTVCASVLYLSEERRTTFRAALKRAGLEDATGLHLAFRQNTRASWPEISRAVITKSKALGIGLVICDTLSDWSGLQADKENDAGAALEAMRPLQAIAAAGPAVLVLRHERKSGGEVGESARGSSAFGGAADILLSLKKDTVPGHDNRRILDAVGRLEGTPPRLILEMADGHYRSLGTSAQVEAANARGLLLSVLSIREDDAITEQQILEEAGEQVTRSTLKRVMDELLARGALHRAKGAGSASAKAYGFWLDEEARL